MSIGGVLEQARRAAGLTVAQVSQQTKIPESVIWGIERDDHAVGGAGLWARGHVRSIARAVGADPGPLIREYDAARLAGQRAAPDDEVTLPDLPAVGRRSWVPGYPEASRAAVGRLAGGPDPGEPAPPGLRSGQAAGRAGPGRAAEARAAAGDVAGSGPASGHPPGPPGLGPAAGPGGAAGYPAGPVTVGARAAPGVPEPVSSPVPGSRRRLTRAAMLALALAATLAGVALFVRSPARQAAGRAAAASGLAAHQPAGHRAHHAPAAGTPPAQRPARIRALRPTSATDFGVGGPGQGDDPQLAPLAIDGNPATAWHSNWYTTAGFGNLYPGTGLLLDMGRTVTIAAVRVRLGAARGTGFQVRVGNIPVLADLRPVARAADAADLVRLRLSTPARGRYVLIWLTRLPPDPAGTFQASIYQITLTGRRQP